MSSRFGIAGDRVVVHHSLAPRMVVVEDGQIVELLSRHADIGAPVIDLGALVLMPALIDTNVHIGDPGRPHWEGFATATAAAAAGGVAVLVDMPHTSIPPVVTTTAVAHKHHATAGLLRVDVGLWGGIVPGNLVEARQMADAGVFGFTAFLGGSSFREYWPIHRQQLEAALRTAHDLSRPLLVHAEMDRGPPIGPSYSAYLQSHPPEAEVEAVAAVIEAVRRTGAWAHILTLSAAEALPMLAAARSEGLMVTVETTPHHLALSAEEIADDATEYACTPPIRDAANRERLWEGLLDGTIDMVVSDHAPVPPRMRAGGFDRAQPGIASLELRLPVMWTEAERRGVGIDRFARWLCEAPARLARLRTGRIEPGMRADLVAWDPDAEFVVDPAALHQRHPLTPYTGRTVRGKVSRTWSAGRTVYAAGTLVGEPAGRVLEHHPGGGR